MPNQRTIAQALGLTQATVSLALRGHPSISKKTRDAVLKAAAKMGYRPNPMVAALMGQIRIGRPVKDQGCLAILYDFEAKSDALDSSPVYRIQLQGFKRQAEIRGYRAECFHLGDSGLDDGRMDRQLYSRGISGLFLAAPKPDEARAVQFRWERYACSSISYGWREPAVDRASTHHRHNVDIAVRKILERGYQRIGMCLPHEARYGVDSNWLAGYLVCESHLPLDRRIPLFKGTPKDTPITKFQKWFTHWRPDVLITLSGEEQIWLSEMGVRKNDIGLVCLNLPPGSSLSGVDENNLEVGATACDIIVNKLAHNERGVPSCPKLLLIDGIWVEGDSLPPRN